ncbi:BTAD domain-containing putative transcriptional regulator [Pseudonocardia sp.]|uniref:AfsR/SARP family transcriptional regulator n=1 Tax=Pseudonocardia sp. TaxID=60912 RepID=UPI0031FBC7BD
MRFEVLGPLQITDGDPAAPLVITAGRLRSVLAVLLLHANQPVPAAELAEWVWEGAPPASAVKSVRVYVARLRVALGPRAAAYIATHDPGYRIRLTEAELDLLEFEAACRRADEATHRLDWTEVSTAAGHALGLWRSSPLVDVPVQRLRDQWLPVLEQRRRQALEQRLDAELRLGRHSGLVPELRDLVVRYPLRERFHAQLMVALSRCGQRGAALDAYRQARRLLVDELGLEPGPELREVHERILTGTLDPDRAAGPAVSVAAAAPPAAATPRQLPAAVASFTGREPELRTLGGLLDGITDDAGLVLISAIDGTAGVGKTALAVHWAHRVATRFPDGQLYVNLRGYDAQRPLTPAAALAGFLRALGVSGRDVPVDVDERAGRYRSLLSGRRVLVVLDNAGTADQVRPLLPGSGGCVVVVTSRDPLAGLVARDGARRIDLDALPAEEAMALLRALIGGRADADPGSTATLARQCAGLPLALRLAAERAAASPAEPLADLVAELADLQRRLDLLDIGPDPHTALRAVFSWSYERLNDAAARAFRLIGLHYGAGLDANAVAALIDGTLEHSRRLLDDLVRAHLIQHTGSDRYAMHDLLRAYARELSAGTDPADDRHDALARLADHYLHAAGAAVMAWYPTRRGHRLPPPARVTWSAFADRGAALEWLDTERANLVLTVIRTAEDGSPRHAVLLAATIFIYLETGAHFSDALTVHTHAYRAATDLGDLAGQARALARLGTATVDLGQHDEAAGHLGRALDLFRRLDDPSGAAHALTALGRIAQQHGRYPQAIDYYEQVLAAELDPDTETDRVLCNLGLLELRLGRYGAAAEHLDEAQRIARRRGDGNAESGVLDELGNLYSRLGDHGRAEEAYQRAKALCVQVGNPYGVAHVTLHLAELAQRQGRYPEAGDGYRRALVQLRQLGDRFGEAEARAGLGDLALRLARTEDAYTHHTAALYLAGQTGDAYLQARAHEGLGHAHRAARDPVSARRHWQEARTRYMALGTSEAATVADHLAELHS